jgi:hypothetical protein
MITVRRDVLVRALNACGIIACLVLVPIRGASAQFPLAAELADPEDSRAVPRFERDLSDPGERASIDLESNIATALYVQAAIGLGLSAVLEVAALIVLMTNAPDPFFSPGSGGLKTFEVLGAIGGVIGGIGVLALPIAIGLHVDSHSRRDALDRSACTRLYLTPGGLVLSGGF